MTSWSDMKQIDESTAEKDLDNLLDQVERGEVFAISRKGKSIARLEPYYEANEPPEQKRESL